MQFRTDMHITVVSICRIFKFSCLVFFEEMPDEIKSREGGYKKCMMDSEQSDIDVDPLSRRETIELVRNN